jgi:hypothetical protein
MNPVYKLLGGIAVVLIDLWSIVYYFHIHGVSHWSLIPVIGTSIVIGLGGIIYTMVILFDNKNF